MFPGANLGVGNAHFLWKVVCSSPSLPKGREGLWSSVPECRLVREGLTFPKLGVQSLDFPFLKGVGKAWLFVPGEQESFVLSGPFQDVRSLFLKVLRGIHPLFPSLFSAWTQRHCELGLLLVNQCPAQSHLPNCKTSNVPSNYLT